MRARFTVPVAAITIAGILISQTTEQSAMSTVGLTAKDIESNFMEEILRSKDSFWLPSMGQAGKKAAIALSEAQRVAVVRTLGAFLKRVVMSDAFQAAYAAKIKDTHNAVNHGIKDLNAMPADPMATAQRQTAVQMAKLLRTFPHDVLKTAFAQDHTNWAEQIKEGEPEEKARAQKMIARAKTIAPLMQSNPEEFRKAYSLLKCIELGGPDTEAALNAEADNAEAEVTKRMQQQAWDEHNFRKVLKAKLTAFVAECSNVDYAAETTTKNGRKIFVNPAYERKSGTWKAMYRAGRAPSLAALEIARGWLKEL